MNEILQKLRIDFTYLTGAKFSGIAESLCLGFASRLSEFDSKTRFIEKQAFVETADKDYLTLHAGYLLKPNFSKFAKGTVVFFGERLAEVPSGTVVKDSTGEYAISEKSVINKYYFIETASVVDKIVTLPPQLDLPSCECEANGNTVTAISTAKGFIFESNTINNGDTVTITVNCSSVLDTETENFVIKPVPVQAIKPGSFGNKPLSASLQTKLKVSGINQNLGVVSITGGTDEEDTESYRKRVKHLLANPQAPFNVENIRHEVTSQVPDIVYVWVIGGEVTPGFVEVFVAGRKLKTDTTTISAFDKKQALDAVQQLRPPNLPPARITVSEPTYLKAEVKITSLVPSNEQLKTEITKNLRSLFSSSGLFNKGLTADAIKSAIYRSESASERVQSFTLTSGALVAKPKSLYVLDKVDFL